jgi:hypothetical protein
MRQRRVTRISPGVTKSFQESSMTSFTFSAEQLRAAPPEVRRWAEAEIGRAFALLAERAPAPSHGAPLAACTPAEAAQIFELIKGDFLLSQVFFELARDTMPTSNDGALHALSIGDIIRHTRLSDGDRLVEYFTALNAAFQRVRNDSEASLFGFDAYGHVFIHETTHQSIRRVWEALHMGEPGAGALSLPAMGFAPPRVGPSESIAEHVTGPAAQPAF